MNIYASRGITRQEDLDISLNSLLHFKELLGIEKATQRVVEAIKAQQSILIIGDFDADGATSTSLAVSALRAFGAEKVDFLVPNRFNFGYGLSPEIVEVAKTKSPDLLITVDNGISSIDGVRRANELGMDVVVTDHHLPGDEVPDAYAIVNPNQRGCAFPSKSIAGVGVIFYLMASVRASLKEAHFFEERNQAIPNMGCFLDLVALGTVADVVPLDKNNRILVEQGLRRIRQGEVRAGIKALFANAKRDRQFLKAQDLGFAVGPRLNAAGRLDDMSLGIACLLSHSEKSAKEMAMRLDLLNQERKEIEQEMKEGAFKVIANLKLDNKHLPVGLCLFDESWHQGVIGIVAGRLKETYSRPVIVFAASEDKQELKGSARSIMGINIRDVLSDVATTHPGLIIKFGGHAMAAGLSLKPENFQPFREAFEKELSKVLNEKDCVSQILSDGALSPRDFSLEFAKLIERSGPWGSQFEQPIFDNVFEMVSQRIVGQNHLKLSLRVEESDCIVDGIYFNVDLKEWPNHHCRKVHAAYKLDINRYLGRENVQLMVEHLEPEHDR
jgi:single-stranded-DNA-specific exonuclease